VSRVLEDGEDLVLAGQSPQLAGLAHPDTRRAPLPARTEFGVLVAGDMVASEGTILIEPGDGDMERT
jgi:hypothetical protein